MALEIKELIVRINVQENAFPRPNQERVKGEIDAQTIRQIVRECTEKVLEIIERNKER